VEKKVVLIVLIVIAVVAFMFLGAGLARGSRDRDPSAKSYEPGGVMKKMDNAFAFTRKEFDLSRMVPLTSGCTLSNGLLSFSGECGLVIKPSKTKSSVFYLKRGASRAEACYAFSNDALRDCWADGDKRSELRESSHRFVVTGDSAFMQLRCTTIPSGQCGIAVALKD